MAIAPDVVIIEANERLRTILEYNLNLDGFTVATAENPRTGLQLIKKAKPASILLGLQTGTKDGLELLEQLKADAETAATPVFILGPETVNGELEKSRSLGAEDFFKRPFDPIRLGLRLHRRLRNSSLNLNNPENKENRSTQNHEQATPIDIQAGKLQ